MVIAIVVSYGAMLFLKIIKAYLLHILLLIPFIDFVSLHLLSYFDYQFYFSEIVALMIDIVPLSFGLVSKLLYEHLPYWISANIP